MAPDLDMEIAFESFNNSGKHSYSTSNLKNIDRGGETTSEAIFRKEEDMPLGPKNRQFFNEEIILLISWKLVRVRKQIFLFCFGDILSDF